jgi:hypothetical protein
MADTARRLLVDSIRSRQAGIGILSRIARKVLAEDVLERLVIASAGRLGTGAANGAHGGGSPAIAREAHVLVSTAPGPKTGGKLSQLLIRIIEKARHAGRHCRAVGLGVLRQRRGGRGGRRGRWIS